MSIFAKAAKEKVRFNYHGLITTEDLFDLNMETLDFMYREVHKKLKDQSGDGLINDVSINVDVELLQLQLDLIKYVFEYKKASLENEKAARDRNRKKQRLMEIIASKQDKALEDKSVDELMKMIDEI
jgi:hypothetical protein